ncbi:hypothetical protein F5884DRAFT_857911 [Xylogone sp. PMI_703]|nr:hypothetical protein F5884DRAFT_857911 [Xylogone sp. PMI_703]
MPNSRPSIQARDSSGRQVSLLNDDFPAPSPPSRSPIFIQRSPHTTGFEFVKQSRSNSYTPSQSGPPSPTTPDLLRSQSYDSQATQDPLSPLTPTSVFEFARLPYIPPTTNHFAPGYEHLEKSSYSNDIPALQRPVTATRPRYSDSRPYDDASTASGSSSGPVEKGSKRYPCRFRESHGCEKTFTTSGHASRHSKIHTAEKAVHCSFAGCHKKFTRADNMKQHLETHYKGRSRSSSSQNSSSKSALTVAAGVKKSTASDRLSRSPSRIGKPENLKIDSRVQSQYASDSCPIVIQASHSGSTTPVSPYSSMDMTRIQHALMSHQVSLGSEKASAGLDVLALAVACQSRT